MGWAEEKLEHVVREVVREVVKQGELTRAANEASLASTLRGLRLDGALSRPIRPNAETFTAAGRLVGWSLRAVGGDVTVNFRDGHTTDADIVATVFIPAGTSSNIGSPGAGISFVDALYTEVVTTGAVVGSVWIGAVD